MYSVPQDLIDLLAIPDGGFTWNPRTGAAVREGYAVSPFPGRERVERWRRVTGPYVDRYVENNSDKLTADRETFVGAWNNPATGLVHVDVTIVVDTAARAKALAKKYDQIAYYDFAAGKSIPADKILAA